MSSEVGLSRDRPLYEGLARPFTLLRQRPGALAGVLALMILAGTLEGLGVLLLIPLLAMVGIQVSGEGALGQVADFFEAAFGAVGLPASLPVVLATYVLVVAVQSGIRYQEGVRSAALVEELKAGLRERVFEAVARADWLFHLRSRSSDVLHLVTDEVSRIGSGLDQALRLSTAALTAVIYLGVAFYLSPLATTVALVTAAVLLLILRERSARSRRAGEAFSDAAQALYFQVSEFLGGLKSAKSHASEEPHIRAFSRETRGLADAWVQAARSYGDVRLWFTVGAVMVLSLLVWAAVEVIQLEAAALLVLIYIFLRLIPRFSAIQNNFQYLANALPAFERVDRLVAEAEAAREAAGGVTQGGEDGLIAPSLQEGIRLEGVSFEYPEAGDRPAVRGVTLEIPARRATALVGPSGAGKTTLADLVIGLLRPREGEILVDGTPLSRIDLRQWRKGIGYVPQESFLLNGTIRMNLDSDREEIWRALHLARLDGFVESLPRGLDTVVGERGVRLSGGERQRLALARALVRRPRLLILDEATSALDYENEALVREAVQGLQGEMTVLMITHRLPLVRGADRIHVIEGGRRVESGTWEELMGSDTRFRTLAASAGAPG